MKHTANRRIYDTEDALEMVKVTKSYGVYGENKRNDWTETLYRKSNGEYFVVGSGGESSPFADYSDGKSKPGCRFIIWRNNNENNAKLWVHDNAPEQFDRIFNERNDDEIVKITITISEKGKKNLKRYADETRMSVSEIIRKYAESLYEE